MLVLMVLEQDIEDFQFNKDDPSWLFEYFSNTMRSF